MVQLDYYDICELFDDLIDRDKDDDLRPERIERILWEVLVDYAGNPFFLRHARTLLPVVSMGINYWLDANDLEREGTDASLQFSYVLRDAYMQVTQTVVELTRGREAMRACSLDIIRFFGATESIDAYRAKLRER